jgi:hypothetical protein
MAYTDLTTTFGYNMKMLASHWDSLGENAAAAYLALTERAFHAYRSTAQTIVNSQEVVFDSETVDIGGYYDTATGRYTPPVGRYMLYAALTLDGATLANNTAHGLVVLKNGSTTTPSLGTLHMRKTFTQNRTVSFGFMVNQTSASDAWSIMARSGLTDTYDVLAGATLSYFGGRLFPAEA